MGRRLFDLTVALAGLALFLIPGLVVCLAQKAASRGPIFYLQRRAGRRGVPFSLYKFRTMTVQQAAGASMLTAAKDQRVTPIGRFLRRWKIDEVPQLWNVVRGDMSIVGPRPEVERFVSRYTPEQREVLTLKPGLAFMAQLVYPHEPDLLESHPDPERAYVEELMPMKLKADLDYMKRRTFLSDLALIGEVALLVAGRRPRMDRAFRFRPVVTGRALEEVPR